MDSSGGIVKTKARVQHSYTPEQDDELRLEVGEIIDILKQDEEGWWEGNLNGRVGMFPSNFVELIPDTPAQENNEKGDESKDQVQFREIKGKKVQGVGLGNIFGGGPIKLRPTSGLQTSVKKEHAIDAPESKEEKTAVNHEIANKRDSDEIIVKREKTVKPVPLRRHHSKGVKNVIASQGPIYTTLIDSYGDTGSLIPYPTYSSTPEKYNLSTNSYFFSPQEPYISHDYIGDPEPLNTSFNTKLLTDSMVLTHKRLSTSNERDSSSSFTDRESAKKSTFAKNAKRVMLRLIPKRFSLFSKVNDTSRDSMTMSDINSPSKLACDICSYSVDEMPNDDKTQIDGKPINSRASLNVNMSANTETGDGKKTPPEETYLSSVNRRGNLTAHMKSIVQKFNLFDVSSDASGRGAGASFFRDDETEELLSSEGVLKRDMSEVFDQSSNAVQFPSMILENYITGILDNAQDPKLYNESPEDVKITIEDMINVVCQDTIHTPADGDVALDMLGESDIGQVTTDACGDSRDTCLIKPYMFKTSFSQTDSRMNTRDSVTQVDSRSSQKLRLCNDDSVVGRVVKNLESLQASSDVYVGNASKKKPEIPSPVDDNCHDLRYTITGTDIAKFGERFVDAKTESREDVNMPTILMSRMTQTDVDMTYTITAQRHDQIALPRFKPGDEVGFDGTNISDMKTKIVSRISKPDHRFINDINALQSASNGAVSQDDIHDMFNLIAEEQYNYILHNMSPFYHLFVEMEDASVQVIDEDIAKSYELRKIDGLSESLTSESSTSQSSTSQSATSANTSKTATVSTSESASNSDSATSTSTTNTSISESATITTETKKQQSTDTSRATDKSILSNEDETFDEKSTMTLPRKLLSYFGFGKTNSDKKLRHKAEKIREKRMKKIQKAEDLQYKALQAIRKSEKMKNCDLRASEHLIEKASFYEYDADQLMKQSEILLEKAICLESKCEYINTAYCEKNKTAQCSIEPDYAYMTADGKYVDDFEGSSMFPCIDTLDIVEFGAVAQRGASLSSNGSLLRSSDGQFSDATSDSDSTVCDNDEHKTEIPVSDETKKAGFFRKLLRGFWPAWRWKSYGSTPLLPTKSKQGDDKRAMSGDMLAAGEYDKDGYRTTKPRCDQFSDAYRRVNSDRVLHDRRHVPHARSESYDSDDRLLDQDKLLYYKREAEKIRARTLNNLRDQDLEAKLLDNDKFPIDDEASLDFDGYLRRYSLQTPEYYKKMQRPLYSVEKNNENYLLDEDSSDTQNSNNSNLYPSHTYVDTNVLPSNSNLYLQKNYDDTNMLANNINFYSQQNFGDTDVLPNNSDIYPQKNYDDTNMPLNNSNWHPQQNYCNTDMRSNNSEIYPQQNYGDTFLNSNNLYPRPSFSNMNAFLNDSRDDTYRPLHLDLDSSYNFNESYNPAYDSQSDSHSADSCGNIYDIKQTPPPFSLTTTEPLFHPHRSTSAANHTPSPNIEAIIDTLGRPQYRATNDHPTIARPQYGATVDHPDVPHPYFIESYNEDDVVDQNATYLYGLDDIVSIDDAAGDVEVPRQQFYVVYPDIDDRDEIHFGDNGG